MRFRKNEQNYKMLECDCPKGSDAAPLASDPAATTQKIPLIL